MSLRQRRIQQTEIKAMTPFAQNDFAGEVIALGGLEGLFILTSLEQIIDRFSRGDRP